MTSTLPWASARGTSTLLAIAGVWVALGWSGVWRNLAEVVSQLDCELYPYRFLTIAMVLATAVIVLQAQRASRRWPRWRGAIAVGLFLAAVPMALRSRELAEVAVTTDARPLLRTLDAYMRREALHPHRDDEGAR